ncbi:MAG: DoxX family membrane protein [Eudoraea sp.]|nr:DoxX family membrane protein [Eudoraea sp.]
MKIFWSVVRLLFAGFMIYAGVQHLLKPEFYIPFVPSFLPFTMAIVYASGFIEILLGVFLLIPKFAKLGALGLVVLMILFLPIHIWDVFTDTPAIGSHKAALIRLAVQLLFIAIPWKLKTVLTR